jgi:sigma-54 dependent transcriptional regulator, acetoin dehydrogenase operon transcriptional activator AcoR
MVQSTRNTTRHLQGSARGAAMPVPAQPQHADLIEQSHLRCSAFGLTRIERPEYEPMMRSDLTVARERNQRLFAHAAPVMEMLFEQIAGTESMIVLTDAQGTILHSVGDADFLGRASKVALAPGVNWAEHSKGTNAIGTALFEAMPTLVHAGEHFMHANHFLTCSAAPIFDPRGDMLGVLDVSGDQRSFHQHTMGLVRMSARMIENHWLCDDNSNRLRVHFHSRVEFIGTLLEGILVIGEGGKILGANRSALDQLNLGTVSLRAHTLTSLFGTSVAALSAHFRSPLQLPMQLSVPSGARFHVHARANWAAAVTSAQRGEAADGTNPAAAAPHPAAAAAATEVQAGLKFLQTGDPQVDAVVQKVRRIIDRDIALLILGETGTGKELLARAVHQDSSRAKQAFVVVNCASIDETQIEAELFGCENGAFTGARRKGSPGRIVQANGGTLFLDEIGDMPLAVQARLLRVLQERSVTPLGSQRRVPIDIALIAATHHNLRERVRQQQFREDLYHHLNGLALRLPPLRDRTDLPALTQRILQIECPNGTPEISAPVMGLFRRCAWPGNIRQLANVLRTAAVMASGEALITEAHLSDDFIDDTGRSIVPAAPALPTSTRVPAASPLRPGHEATLEETELELVRSTLAATQGNISEASKRLGVSRNTIYRKLRRARAESS